MSDKLKLFILFKNLRTMLIANLSQKLRPTQRVSAYQPSHITSTTLCKHLFSFVQMAIDFPVLSFSDSNFISTAHCIHLNKLKRRFLLVPNLIFPCPFSVSVSQQAPKPLSASFKIAFRCAKQTGFEPFLCNNSFPPVSLVLSLSNVWVFLHSAFQPQQTYEGPLATPIFQLALYWILLKQRSVIALAFIPPRQTPNSRS